jgi:hypothetical protein
VKCPHVLLSSKGADQRVSGGPLNIPNARNLYTNVMSNGVEVIVRGNLPSHIDKSVPLLINATVHY